MDNYNLLCIKSKLVRYRQPDCRRGGVAVAILQKLQFFNKKTFANFYKNRGLLMSFCAPIK